LGAIVARNKAEVEGVSMRRVLATITCGFMLAFATATNAEPESCHNALDQYKFAKSEVSDALAGYTSCIAHNDGHDDCSSEFSNLQSAQNDFESAVSEYESECP
jgi:hypothetical protein